MKRHGLILIISLISLSVFAGQVSKHGALKVEGTQLVDSKGSPVMLRGDRKSTRLNSSHT